MINTSARPPTGPWQFRLYVVGDTTKSRRAKERIQSICEKYLGDACELEVIDLLEHPERARLDQILAVPVLIRLNPIPVRKVMGDMRDERVVLEALEIETGIEL